MSYVETTTIVRTDEKGRVIRRRITTYVEESEGLIKERVETRHLSNDEYFTRKFQDSFCRSSMDRIFDAYRDFKQSMIWD